MGLYKSFCGDDPLAGEAGIAFLLFFIFFFGIWTTIVIFYTIKYISQLRRVFKYKYHEAQEREERSESDVIRILTYMAFLKQECPSKSLTLTGTSVKLQSASGNCNWNEQRKSACSDIVRFFGLAPNVNTADNGLDDMPVAGASKVKATKLSKKLESTVKIVRIQEPVTRR